MPVCVQLHGTGEDRSQAMPRDDFARAVRSGVAARVGFRCSNPSCQKITSGPAADASRALTIGVAAHVTAASPEGPRFDSSITQEQRNSIENAIWLCQSCSVLVDRDVVQFTATLMRAWKQRAENAAAMGLSAGTKYRPIAATEVRSELSIAQLAAVKALENEFGCHVETDIHVWAGDGWMSLDGAVVRGEDLIAIDIREHHGRGLAYFQIEYLLELCAKLSFPRFQKCAVYLAVVSDGPIEADDPVRSRLEELLHSSGLEGYIRMYRLNVLRAQYCI
jgi:hypothetical protein